MSYPQYFKGDSEELKYYNSAAPILDILRDERETFFDEAYACFVLGEILYDSNRSPLSNAIERDIFRSSFESIFDAFTVAGSFESYIAVFKKIFGDDVDITFTVPDAGKLTIDIVAQGIELKTFVARSIVDDAYVFSPIVTQDGLDNIVFQSIKGFTSQYELEQMLFEMVPAGVYTNINLSLGV